MRLFAIIAGVLVTPMIFVAGSQPAHAEQKNNETVSSQTVKPKEGKIVKIKPGDTLSKIAKTHKTTYPRLFDANKKVKHPDLIYPGDKLRVPEKDEKLKKRPLPGQSVAVAPKISAKKSYSSSSRPVAVSSNAVSGSVWDRLAQCESGGNWSINTGNGYYGGLQFTLSTWRGVGGSGYPHQASKTEQIKRGQILQARSGWGQWPACSARLGL